MYYCSIYSEIVVLGFWGGGGGSGGGEFVLLAGAGDNVILLLRIWSCKILSFYNKSY